MAQPPLLPARDRFSALNRTDTKPLPPREIANGIVSSAGAPLAPRRDDSFSLLKVDSQRRTRRSRTPPPRPPRDRHSALHASDTRPLPFAPTRDSPDAPDMPLTSSLTSSSGGDALAPPTESKMRKREAALAEIVSTEQDYVDTLFEVVARFRGPLSNQGILDADEIKGLFSNVDTILQMNTAFLSALQKPGSNVCDAFVKWSPSLKVYTPYIENFDGAEKLRLELAAKNKKFRSFLESKEAEAERSLQSYLIVPIQRLAKYPLLVREVLRHTPETHPDHAGLVKALSIIKTMVEFINTRKAKFDAFARIREVEEEGRSAAFTTSDRNLVRSFMGTMLKDKLYVRVVNASMSSKLKAPWVDLALSNVAVQTQPCRSGDSPTWSEDFVFPIYRRSADQRLTKTLTLSVCEMKKRGDATIGTAALAVEELRQKYTEKFGETPSAIPLYHPSQGTAVGQLFLQISYSHDAVVEFNNRPSSKSSTRRDSSKSGRGKKRTVTADASPVAPSSTHAGAAPRLTLSHSRGKNFTLKASGRKNKDKRRSMGLMPSSEAELAKGRASLRPTIEVDGSAASERSPSGGDSDLSQSGDKRMPRHRGRDKGSLKVGKGKKRHSHRSRSVGRK